MLINRSLAAGALFSLADIIKLRDLSVGGSH